MRNRPQVPEGLCPVHHQMWIKWSLVEYNHRHPCEWPGLAVIMDNRTSHADRERGWDRKTLEQLKLIENMCTRGGSPQCGSIKEEES